MPPTTPLRATSTVEAPWYVIPADHKWFSRLAVAKVVVETLRDLNPSYPEVSADKRGELRRFPGIAGERGLIKVPARAASEGH